MFYQARSEAARSFRKGFALAGDEGAREVMRIRRTLHTFNLVVNGANVDVVVDGGAPASYALAGLSSITIQGSSDDDTLTVDSSGGVLALPGGIHFDGGSGSDALHSVGRP